MAPARLKKLMGYAGGGVVPDWLSAAQRISAQAQAGQPGMAGAPSPSTIPNAAVPPLQQNSYLRDILQTAIAPSAAFAPAAVGVVTPPGYAGAGASVGDVARMAPGVGSAAPIVPPTAGMPLPYGPAIARQLAAASASPGGRPSYAGWMGPPAPAAAGPIRYAAPGEINPNPGGPVDIIRAGRYGGGGMPLQMRMALLQGLISRGLQPAQTEAGRTLLAGSMSAWTQGTQALLQKYGERATEDNPAYVQERAALNAALHNDLLKLSGGQPYAEVQAMGLPQNEVDPLLMGMGMGLISPGR